MRFKSLTLAGAIPFPNPVTIDFPEARKIALVGDNGAGKSTLFDCIFAAFFGDVTKPGGLYPLFRNAKDGLIDLTFEQGNHEFRIRRLIDGIGRKQKPYFFIDGQPVTEGKVAEFEAKIQETIGLSERTFLAAVYNCQTQKGNPLSLKDSERRELLSEVLGLNQFDIPFELVSVEHAKVERHIHCLKEQKRFLSDGLQDPEILEEQKKRIADRLIFLDGEIARYEARLQEIAQELANAQANAQQLDEVNRQIQVLDAQIKSDNDAIAALETKIQKNRNELLNRADEIKAAVIETETLQHQNTELEAKIAPLAEAVKQAEAAQAEARKQLHSRLTVERNKQAELRAAFTTASTARQHTEYALKSTEDNIRNHEAQSALLGEVPCVGTELQPACKLLANAHQAAGKVEQWKADVPSLSQQLEEAKAAEAAAAEALNTQDKTVAQLEQEWAQPLEKAGASQQTEIENINQQIRANNARIQQLANLVKNEPYLRDAEERIAGYQQEIQVIRVRLESNTQARADWQKKAEDARNLQETVGRCKAEKETAEKYRADVVREKDSLTPQIGHLDLQIQQARETQSKLEKTDTELEDAFARLSLLEFLKEGLGPKGARALKIDSAGPEISELVNALLRECYGNKFTIMIKTLRDLQSGEQREKLDFAIIDNETGEETPVEQKSGGEQQLIKEVISLGLCIFQRRRAGVDTRTIIRDESCSALTEENTERYVRMLDKACEIGSFDQVLYVSHKSCAQQMADAVISIEKGKVKVIQG